MFYDFSIVAGACGSQWREAPELPKRAPGRRGAKSDKFTCRKQLFKYVETAMQNREIGEGPEQVLYIVRTLVYDKYYVRL